MYALRKQPTGKFDPTAPFAAKRIRSWFDTSLLLRPPASRWSRVTRVRNRVTWPNADVWWRGRAGRKPKLANLPRAAVPAA